MRPLLALPWAGLAAAAGVALWLLVDPRTPDLAAQVYRVSLFRHLGFAVWDEHWYAGHYLPGYSLTFPPLAALLGMRTVATLAVLASAVLFQRLARGLYGEAARWGSVWFALAAVADVWIGRLTFALGVTFALACVLVFVRPQRGRGVERDQGAERGRGAELERGVGRGRGTERGRGAELELGAGRGRGTERGRGAELERGVGREGCAWRGRGGWRGLGKARRRTVAAASLAALCAATSPVAGLLLALWALTHSLLARSPRAALTIGAPAAAVAVALAALFPEGGWEPYPTTSFLASVAVVLGFLWALPPGRRELRMGALVYLGACVLCVALHTPMGANVERYGLLLAAPLLLCALLASPRRGGRFAAAAAAVLCGIAVWTVWGPVRETAAVAGDPSTGAAYYAPLRGFLATHGGRLARIEVPFTRGHWEAAWLAPSVSLARGWEKQLDTRYNLVLLKRGLTATGYRGWLRQQAVTYVALPDVPLDPSSVQEGRLIERGLPYLREVFASRHWRVYRVAHSTPLVGGPGWLTALDHDSFTLLARAPGSFLVRIHYTRYWTLTYGTGCVGPAPGGWTSVDVGAPGSVSVAVRFSLGRALGGGTRVCRSGSGGWPGSVGRSTLG